MPKLLTGTPEPRNHLKVPTEDLAPHIVRALSDPRRCSACARYLDATGTPVYDALRRCVCCSLEERAPVLPQNLDASERRLLRLGAKPVSFRLLTH